MQNSFTRELLVILAAVAETAYLKLLFSSF